MTRYGLLNREVFPALYVKLTETHIGEATKQGQLASFLSDIAQKQVRSVINITANRHLIRTFPKSLDRCVIRLVLV